MSIILSAAILAVIAAGMVLVKKPITVTLTEVTVAALSSPFQGKD